MGYDKLELPTNNSHIHPTPPLHSSFPRSRRRKCEQHPLQLSVVFASKRTPSAPPRARMRGFLTQQSKNPPSRMGRNGLTKGGTRPPGHDRKGTKTSASFGTGKTTVPNRPPLEKHTDKLSVTPPPDELSSPREARPNSRTCSYRRIRHRRTIRCRRKRLRRGARCPSTWCPGRRRTRSPSPR